MRSFFVRLKALVPRYLRDQDQDMQEELAALEQFASRRELGNLTRAAEEARAVLSFPSIQGVGADVRYAWRSLKRDRSFTFVALVSFLIGVAANVAVFGLMDALLWQNLPIRNPKQVVSFENTSRSYFGYSEFTKSSGKALQSVLAQSSVFEIPVDLGSGPVRRQVEFVNGGYFEELGVAPEAGRSILPFDDGIGHAARVAMLSFSYWRRVFGQDRGAIGEYLHIGNAQFLIVGVAPEDFFGLSVGEAPDLWLPLTAYSAVFPGMDFLSAKNNNWLNIFGRLRSGVSIGRAQAMRAPLSVEIDIQRNRLVPSPLERRAMLNDSIRLVPASKGISQLRYRFSKPLHVVFGMLGIGLLLACINVVSLQIARADRSRKEFAIRLAIGAGRLRVARQCLIEMLMVSGASVCLALLFFRPIANAIVSVMTVWGNVPAHLDLKLNGDVLIFVCLLCIAVAVLCGLLPGFYATSQSLPTGLHAGSSPIAGPRSSVSTVRVIGSLQLAVSLILITATTLFALNLQQLRGFDAGVHRDRLVEIEVNPLAAGYSEQRAVFLDESLRNRLRSISGVEHVSYSQDGIYSERNFSSEFRVEGDGSSSNKRDGYGVYDYVGPNFFTTLGTSVVQGRDLTDRDTAAAPAVVIINQTFASRFFPAENPIGRSVYIPEQKGRKPYQIVGVVRDVKSNLRSTGVAWYLASQQNQVHPFSTYFLIRTGRSNIGLLTRVNAALHAEDSKLQIDRLRTADQLFEATLQTDRLLARLGWGFGILALLLASAGIYGLLSYDVTRRTGEIGIRTALGAQRFDIAKLMLVRTIYMLAVGLALGGIAANFLTRSLQSLVFGIVASDPRIEAFSALLLIVVALAATWVPIRRAARIDPLRALRAE